VRFAFALCLAGALLAPIMSSGADRKESGGPWIATAAIIRNGEQTGSGVYLNSGLIITAAHLTAADAKMGVRIAGMVLPELPAKILKQGSAEDVDLSLLLIDEEKLLTSIRPPGYTYVKRHPGQGIWSLLWTPGMQRNPESFHHRCYLLRCEQSFLR
jgi:hypothetical protein